METEPVPKLVSGTIILLSYILRKLPDKSWTTCTIIRLKLGLQIYRKIICTVVQEIIIQNGKG